LAYGIAYVAPYFRAHDSSFGRPDGGAYSDTHVKANTVPDARAYC
jgi:hypothetical protein